jgi:hypothetical protein
MISLDILKFYVTRAKIAIKRTTQQWCFYFTLDLFLSFLFHSAPLIFPSLAPQTALHPYQCHLYTTVIVAVLLAAGMRLNPQRSKKLLKLGPTTKQKRSLKVKIIDTFIACATIKKIGVASVTIVTPAYVSICNQQVPVV